MKDNSQKVLDAIKEYQVPGCVNDFNERNFSQNGIGVEWDEHVAGTVIVPPGCTLFLGMPVGFNQAEIRLPGETFNDCPKIKINIFIDFAHCQSVMGYDYLNVPVWKWKNGKGHTFVKGLCPRVNRPFLNIILEDCMDAIDCYALTEKDMEGMD